MLISIMYGTPADAVISTVRKLLLQQPRNSPYASQNTEHTHWPQYGYNLEEWVDMGRDYEEEEEEEEEDDWYSEDDYDED